MDTYEKRLDEKQAYVGFKEVWGTSGAPRANLEDYNKANNNYNIYTEPL